MVQTNGVSEETREPERLNTVTGQYAAAMVGLAREQKLPFVDLWSELATHQGWQAAYLEDGLHLTPAGNKAVFDLIIAKINHELPSLRCCATSDTLSGIMCLVPLQKTVNVMLHAQGGHNPGRLPKPQGHR